MYDNYAVYVENLYKNYGNKEILKDMCMHVERGNIYGLLGASGCGKTTLLSCIVGRKKYHGGQIFVLGGKPGEPGSGVPGPRVGYMPQDIALVKEFTVKDAVFYFGTIFGMSSRMISERFQYLKKLLELPPDNRLLGDCSGGQQRRVSFAAALIHKPELLILDEPTVGVDPLLRDRIWQHLVELTNKERISVIITTHYIEEARQANKIGLMREGRLLAEESPNRLMQIFNADSLEEVFLILSRKQEEGKLDNLSNLPPENQSHSVMDESNRTESTVSVASIPVSETVASTDKLSKDLQKVSNILNKQRFKALLDKNWKQFYRNVAGICFLLLFPFIQPSIFLAAVGADIKNIPIGIVNEETNTISCKNFNVKGTTEPYDDNLCHFHNMSCRFLTYLDHPMIRKVQYPTLEKAKEGVLHGEIVGVLYMSGNFSETSELRIEDGKDAENSTLDNSQIQVWMDMSNRQIGATIKYKLIDLYKDFQTQVFDDCNFTRGLGKYPVNIEGVHGELDEPYTIFMTPGVILTIIFFMGSIMTCQIILTDRHDGVWDRSIVAGVTSLEITFSHFALQLCVNVIQSLEIAIVVYAIYKQHYIGNIFLLYLMIWLQGLCGMAYGFMVSVIAVNHTMANIVLTGIFLPMMMLSGLMWPTEGMPYGLRIMAKCLPFTICIESFRNVAIKGWTLSNPHVLDGLAITVGWILFYAIFSVYLIKTKR